MHLRVESKKKSELGQEVRSKKRARTPVLQTRKSADSKYDLLFDIGQGRLEKHFPYQYGLWELKM